MLHRLELPPEQDRPDRFYRLPPVHGKSPIPYQINLQMAKWKQSFPVRIHLFQRWPFLLRSDAAKPAQPLLYAARKSKERICFSVDPQPEPACYKRSVSAGECPSDAVQRWSMSQSTLPITRNTVFY